MTEAPWKEHIVAALSTHATGPRKHRSAVVDAVDQITFAQLYERARRISETITERPDAARRHLVAIQATSRISFLAAVFGILLSGNAPLPVPARALHEVREHLCRLRLPEGPASCRPWIATVSSHTGRRSIWITHGEPPTSPRKALALGMQPDGTSLLASPLHLAGPLEYAVRQVLLGGAVVLTAPFHPALWVDAARTWRPTWAFATPTQLRRLVDGNDDTALRDAFASLAVLVHSSQPCPVDLRCQLVELLGRDRLREYYGTIQYDGTIAAAPANAEPAAGRAIPGTELRVVDDDGTPVPIGQVGAIEGRSSTGLVTHALEEACPPPGSWRCAGDHGRLAADQSLELTSVTVPGRAIVGGVKVSLDHVQTVLERHPLVSGCLVTVIPHAVYGDAIAVHVTTADPAPSERDVAAYCRNFLDAAERPRRIVITSPVGHHAQTTAVRT